MFSGIVQTQGIIQNIQQVQKNLQLSIKTSELWIDKVKNGDSIAIDGVCLTVVNKDKTNFDVEIMPESIKRTNLKDLCVNQQVNLEKALRLQDRIDGHIVQGHVDFCTELIEQQADQNALKLIFSLPKTYQQFVVEKGSIAIDGVSLTVVSTTGDSFEVDLIPYTREKTVLGNLKKHDKVNVETDILGKYLVRQMDLGVKLNGYK